MVRNFGFGSTTLLPFPGETAGILTDPSAWSNRSKPTIAFGQEVSVSAMQMLAAATVLTNGGILLKPQILRKVVSPQGTVLQEYGREPMRDVISPRTAADMLLMMETATGQNGTATRAAVKGVRVSAKTGTGQMIDPKTGVYSDTAFLASCLSIFPTEDPRVIVYAVIDHPKGRETLGGRIAAPLAAAFSEEIVTCLGIPRDTDTIVEHSGAVRIERRLLPEIGETLPDLRGYAKREVLPLFSDPRIQLKIKGEGWVVRQDPEPGTPVTTGMTVTLELE
jgi:cell division protein FtsI (penicillin-binding protein 3)